MQRRLPRLCLLPDIDRSLLLLLYRVDCESDDLPFVLNPLVNSTPGLLFVGELMYLEFCSELFFLEENILVKQ